MFGEGEKRERTCVLSQPMINFEYSIFCAESDCMQPACVLFFHVIKIGGLFLIG